jgi:hypothetical protein
MQALRLQTTWGMELARIKATSSSSDSQVQPSSPSAHYNHGTLQPARLASRAAFFISLAQFSHQASLRLLLFGQNSSSASYRIAGFISNIDLRESLKDIHISTVEREGGQGKERRDITCQTHGSCLGSSTDHTREFSEGGSLVVYPSRKDFTTTRCVL